MILNAYSIYDRKALQYHPPFYASTDGSAARSLADLVSDSNTSVGRHPADFVLFCIGTYDDQKGLLQPLSPLRHVADAQALVPPPQRNLFSAADIPTGTTAEFIEKLATTDTKKGR